MRHIIIIWTMLVSCATVFAQQVSVNKTSDFNVSGKGDAAEWKKTDWVGLSHRGGNMKSYESKVKLLYSDSGIYCLFHNSDRKITSTMSADFSDLWKEDVVEIFFWTDEKFPIYFEYELSPRNFELPIIVPNLNGKFLGWRPWKYEGSRSIKHATFVQQDAWIAEFYIPFKVLAPLTNVPPKKGMSWRCNMYRLDHDDGVTRWSWQPVRTNFHDYESFGTIKFE
jgi:hypothetical protein